MLAYSFILLVYLKKITIYNPHATTIYRFIGAIRCYKLPGSLSLPYLARRAFSHTIKACLEGARKSVLAIALTIVFRDMV